MLDGLSVATALVKGGVTHVVWVPDTELGAWEEALNSTPGLTLIRACREGEALAIAGGLLLGGKRPIVLIQCTGFFEAGDALRNLVHDLKLPLFLVVGARSWQAHQQGKSTDSCPVFLEPIVRAWQIPFTWLDSNSTAADLASLYGQSWKDRRAHIVLLPE